MKDLIKKLAIIVICILIQLVVTLIAFVKFSEHFAFIQAFMIIIGILIMLGIIKDSENIENDIIWIILILTFPVMGALLYMIMGHSLLRSNKIKAINESKNKNKEYLKQNESVIKEIENMEEYGQINYISKIAEYPVYKNTEIQYYPLGEKAYKSMLEELKKAKKFIFMEYFIIAKRKNVAGNTRYIARKSKRRSRYKSYV